MEMILWAGRLILYAVLAESLAKAAGEDYKVILEKVAACDDHSSSLADITQLKVVKINGTSVALRGKVTLNNDVSDDMTIKLTIQKYSLGTWITVPFNFPAHNVCEFVKKDTFYFPVIQKSMNLPKQCPFPKGVYQMNNSIITIRKLPAYLPKGCFKVDITFNTQKMKRPSCYGLMALITSPGGGMGASCPSTP